MWWGKISSGVFFILFTLYISCQSNPTLFHTAMWLGYISYFISKQMILSLCLQLLEVQFNVKSINHIIREVLLFLSIDCKLPDLFLRLFPILIICLIDWRSLSWPQQYVARSQEVRVEKWISYTGLNLRAFHLTCAQIDIMLDLASYV